MTAPPSPASGRPDWATVPNAVTLVRLLLLVPVCVLIVDGGPDTLSVVLLLVWALTDWIDGALARLLDQTSRFGQVLDPVADRIGLVGIVLALALAHLLPWAALVVVAGVDVVVAITTSRAALRRDIGVSRLGKARTALLMTSVFLIVAAAAWLPAALVWAQGLLWLAVALHLVAGAGYIRAVRSAARAAGAPASRR